MDMRDYQAKTFRPTGGRMLIKVDPLDKVSKGGIKLITQAADPIDRGTIVAIDMTGYNPKTQKEINNEEYSIGDRVIFNYGVKEYMEFSDGMHVLLDQSQIYGIVRNETDA